MSQRIAVPSSLGTNGPLIGLIELGLLDPEDEGGMKFQNIGNLLTQ